MSHSQAFGNQMTRFALSTKGAQSYSKELPKEAVAVATELEKQQEQLHTLNSQQEKAKAAVAEITGQMKVILVAARKNRSRIVRYAEATFGPRSPKIKEFRPATEGKIRKPRSQKAGSPPPQK